MSKISIKTTQGQRWSSNHGSIPIWRWPVRILPLLVNFSTWQPSVGRYLAFGSDIHNGFINKGNKKLETEKLKDIIFMKSRELVAKTDHPISISKCFQVHENASAGDWHYYFSSLCFCFEVVQGTFIHYDKLKQPIQYSSSQTIAMWCQLNKNTGQSQLTWLLSRKSSPYPSHRNTKYHHTRHKEIKSQSCEEWFPGPDSVFKAKLICFSLLPPLLILPGTSFPFINTTNNSSLPVTIFG